MTITVKKMVLTEHPQARQTTLEHNFDVIGNIEVQCLVRLGSVTMTVDALRQLRIGQTIELEQKTHEPVDIILNNQVIARGELMSCEEYFAIQVIELCC